MKKFTLLSSALALAVGSLQAQVPMTPLVEHFTQASCPPCASQNPTLYNTLDNYSGDYVKLTYQTSWPGTDPMNTAYPAGPAARVTRHGVSGVPNVSMNGGAPGAPNTVVTNATLTTAAGMMSDFQIDVMHQYLTGNDLEVTIQVSNQGMTNQPAGKKLFVALTERTIIYPTPPGSNGETEFFYVVRNMYNPLTGASATTGGLLPAINMGDTVTYTFAITAPSYVRSMSELGFAAFMEDPANNDDILQSGYSEPVVPAGAMDVSTAGGVFSNATGDYCDGSLTPQFTVTNEMAGVITSIEAAYSINGGAAVPITLSGLNLAQGASTDVIFPATTLSGGSNTIDYEIVSLNGGTSDFSALNNRDLSGTLDLVSPTAVGPNISSDFQSTPLFSRAPDNAISINPNGVRAYQVDASISNSVTWNLGGFGNSDGCYRWDFWAINGGEIATILYEKIDMTANANANGAQLKWAQAHAPYSANSMDRLRVKISTDCGATWTTASDKAGTALATAPVMGGGRFYPNINQWAWDSIDLTSYLNETDLMIAFEGVSDYGNSLYVDDINTEFSYPVNVDRVDAPVANFTLFPNPVSDVLNVAFETATAADLTLTITNALGQTLEEVASGRFVGPQNLSINTASLAPGIYFINAVSETGVTTQRFVVER